MKIKKQISQWTKIKCKKELEIHSDNILEYKILVLGDSLVGKSSICTKFALNDFNLEINSSTNIECFSKSMKLMDDYIQVYLIDVHSNVLKNPKSNIYTDVKGAIFVYDITKTKSFENIDDWVQNIQNNIKNTIPYILIGNKNDLNFLRNIEYEKGLEKAKILNCEFFEASCTNKQSIYDAITYLISQIYYDDLSKENKDKLENIFLENDNNN